MIKVRIKQICFYIHIEREEEKSIHKGVSQVDKRERVFI